MLTNQYLLNEILNALNNNLMVGGLFCKWEKAFDCDNHHLLLSQLEFYGIIGRTHKLIKCYLEDRLQGDDIVSNVLHNTASSD